MGSSGSKPKEKDKKEKEEEKKEKNENEKKDENDNNNSEKNKKTKSPFFFVEIFTEDEDDINKSSNNDENIDDILKDFENSEKDSKLEIRIFDYSSSDSESSIDYEVIRAKEEKDKKSSEKKEEKKPEKKQEKEEVKKEEEKKEDKKLFEKKEEVKKEEEQKEEKEEKKEEKKEKEEEKPKKKIVKKKKKKKSDSGSNINSDKSSITNKSKNMVKDNKIKTVNKPIVEESSSSEFESEKIDSPHPSQLLESNIKEIIYCEYLKNKKFYTPEEKKCYSEINKDSYESCTKNKYRKNILLHKDEITSICALDAKTKSIAYATSSLDRTIKFWTGKFKLIDTISNLLLPALYLSEFDRTNILSAEGVYIKMYDLISQIYECKFIFRDHIEEIYIIFTIITRTSMKFLSGGKDKIIRLWIPDSEAPIRYYEGHKNSIISIQNVGKNKKLMASIAEDKKCIIWEVNNSNMIYEFDNYFSPLSLADTKKGFYIGAYDNKIRFYNSEYLLEKCIKFKFYGLNLLMGDDAYLFVVMQMEISIL
jgi:hypothetical protein